MRLFYHCKPTDGIPWAAAGPHGMPSMGLRHPARAVLPPIFTPFRPLSARLDLSWPQHYNAMSTATFDDHPRRTKAIPARPRADASFRRNGFRRIDLTTQGL